MTKFIAAVLMCLVGTATASTIKPSDKIAQWYQYNTSTIAVKSTGSPSGQLWLTKSPSEGYLFALEPEKVRACPPDSLTMVPADEHPRVFSGISMREVCLVNVGMVYTPSTPDDVAALIARLAKADGTVVLGEYVFPVNKFVELVVLM